MTIRPSHEQIETELLETNANSIRTALYSLLQKGATSASSKTSLFMQDGNKIDAVVSIKYNLENQLFFMPQTGKKLIIVVNITDPKTHVVMATRSFRSEISEGSSDSLVFRSRSDTMRGFEGLGFGRTLFEESQPILQSAIRRFPTLFQNRAILLFVQDDAKGRELRFNREDWTSRRAESLGYTPVDPGSGEFVMEIKGGS
jgi:hypothetical protein